MKKIVSLLMVMVLTLSTCFVFTSCDDEDLEEASNQTYYVATSDFSYSYDKGHTYGNGTKEYAAGETVYLKVKAKVTTNKETPETVKMKLTIPNITAIDAKYYDGQPITPIPDTVRNVTVYEFTITAAMNAQEWEFVFQFKPNEKAIEDAEVKMLLEFDDKIESIYDKQNTIKFVANSAGE